MRPGRKPLLVLVAALSVASAVAIAFDVWPWLRGPAPYPPEWRWEYRRLAATGRLAAPILCAGGLLALLLLGCRPAATQRHLRRSARFVVIGSVVLGFGFEIGLLGLEPDGAWRTLMRRTLSRTDTSYLTVAASDLAGDPLVFLDHHAELLPELAHVGKHAATHPPGPVLYYRGLLALCEYFPRLANALLQSAGLVAQDAEGPGRRDPARAAALLGGLIILFLSALTAVPVASLARLVSGDEPAAARTAVLWNLLPGPALMSPQFDQALALPVAAAAALVARAAIDSSPGVTTSWRGALEALAAGVLAGLALYVSYGAAAFLLLSVLSVLALVVPDRARMRQAVVASALAFAGASSVFALAVSLGHEPLEAARTALAIHREMFTHPRRYGLWLFFNPLDFAFFVGIPVAALAIVRFPRSASALCRRRGQPLDRMRVLASALFLLLVLSGATRGEVGRIWIPLMPVILVAAACRPAREAAVGPTTTEALLLGSLLALHCIVIRVFWVVP